MRRVLWIAAAAAGLLAVPNTAALAAPAHEGGPAKPPAHVTAVHTFDGAHGTEVVWKNPAHIGHGHVVVRYARAKTPPDGHHGKRARLSGPRATSVTLHHLARNRRYAVAVRVVSKSGRRSATRSTTFTTDALTAPRVTYRERVTDSAGHPLRGVQVDALSYSGFSSTEQLRRTHADGRVRFRLPAGHYLFFTGGQDITGGDTDTTGYAASLERVKVTADPTAEHPVVLDPGGAVRVRVTDESGRPLAGVTPYLVPVEPYVQADNGSSLSYFAGDDEFGGAATTGDDGVAVVKGVPTGHALRLCMNTADAPVLGGAPDAPGYAATCASGSLLTRPGRTSEAPAVALATAQAGTVTGRLTSPSGRGFSGSAVQLSRGTRFLSEVVTGSNGTFRAGGLAPGSYRVCAAGGSYQSAGATGYTSTCAAHRVVVTTGGNASTTVRLHLGGAVTGKIRGPGHVAARGVVVVVLGSGSSASTMSGGAAATDRSGHYLVKGLAAGRHIFCVQTYNNRVSKRSPTGLLPQCHRHKKVVFTVHVGRVRSGLDATLDAGGAVSGRVTDPAGHPVAHALIEVQGKAFDNAGIVESDQHGRYAVGGLKTGRYQVCADQPDDVDSDKPSCRTHHVRVRERHLVRHADLVLPARGAVKVVVHDASGHPVAGVDAAVLQPCSQRFDCDAIPLFDPKRPATVVASEVTNRRGAVALGGLSAGHYAVCLFVYDATTTTGAPATGFADRCTGSSFTIVVKRGGSTTSLSPVLASAGVITGRVTDAAGHPLQGVRVHVTGSAADDVPTDPFDEFGGDPFFDDASPSPRADSLTARDGTYRIRSVRAGSQTVCMDASKARGGSSQGGYFDQCVGGAVNKTGHGTPVDVTAGAVTSGVDLALTASAGLRGHLLGSNSNGKFGAAIYVARGNSVVATVQPGPHGGYSVTQLAAGTYRVCASSYGKHGATGECYDGVAWANVNKRPPFAKATPIEVTAGTSASSIEIRLPR